MSVAALQSARRERGEPAGAPADAGLEQEPGLSGTWKARLARLDYAYQPIVNIHTGDCFGCEALLRGCAMGGFAGIDDVFTSAERDGVLPPVQDALTGMAVAKFARLAERGRVRLFLNTFLNAQEPTVLDLVNSTDSIAGHLARYKLDSEHLCLEISERQNVHPDGHAAAARILARCKAAGYDVALDDFGAGYSGLQQLYETSADYIKIDRFFIRGIHADHKKKLFVSQIIKLAHTLGIAVVAEGVESREEFYVCRDMGCDLVQGYLIQKPTTDISALCPTYAHVLDMVRSDRRFSLAATDRTLLADKMQTTPAVPLYSGDAYTPIGAVFEYLRTQKDQAFVPVVGRLDEPLGVIWERDLKSYVYSPYGKDLLKNAAVAASIRTFVSKCPICEVSTSIDGIISLFSAEVDSAGVVMTENGRYRGFLSAHALLQVINERNLILARDQNPLTKLPGSFMIDEYIAVAIKALHRPHVFCYFDFDSFKPFNDRYGFRQGDRAILLFANALKSLRDRHDAFVAHIGGDDFFAGFELLGETFEEVHALVHDLLARFRDEAASLYPAEDRAAGGIVTKDREGRLRRFPLLTVSAAVVDNPVSEAEITIDQLSPIFARLKTESKASPSHVAFFSTSEFPCHS